MRFFRRIYVVTLTSGLLQGGSLAAEVFRSVDEHGNITLSDTPQDNGEKIEVKPTNTVPAMVIEEKVEAKADPGPLYRAVTINSPKNDEPIRSTSGSFEVRISTTPLLMASHKIELLIDGKFFESSHSGSFALSNIDRGTHQLQGRVRDAEGKIIATGSKISVHILR